MARRHPIQCRLVKRHRQTSIQTWHLGTYVAATHPAADDRDVCVLFSIQPTWESFRSVTLTAFEMEGSVRLTLKNMISEP